MKKLLLLFALVACSPRMVEVQYDFVYGSTAPGGGIEFFSQTKYTTLKRTQLPDTDQEWIDFISQLELIHDLEDGIMDDAYYGYPFFLQNFYW